METGILVIIDNEPKLQVNKVYYDICKGSLIAINDIVTKVYRTFHYQLLSNNKVVLLK